jgi:hypothetical protein
VLQTSRKNPKKDLLEMDYLRLLDPAQVLALGADFGGVAFSVF